MTELINCHWCGKQHDKWITCGSILIDTQELLDLRKRVKEMEHKVTELEAKRDKLQEVLKALVIEHDRECPADNGQGCESCSLINEARQALEMK